MNTRNWRLVAPLMAALALAGCGKAGSAVPAAQAAQTSTPAPASAQDQTSELLTPSAEEISVAGIRSAPLAEQPVRDQVAVTATIQANQDRLARVSPRIPGKIVKVLVKPGEKVKAGQPLALIDSIEAGDAQSAYAQAAAELSLAKSASARAEKLYGEQIIAQKDYLRARADLQKAQAAMQAAAARRRALGLEKRGSAAGAQNSVFAVIAPFAGTVIDKKAVLGELAGPEHALFTVADLSTVWIDTSLFEKDLARVNVGAGARVNVAAYPRERFQGKLTYIASVMDRETRTAKARIEVPNPDGRLKLDMFANAMIDTGGTARALLLPEDAVVLVQGQPTVFVKKGSGFAPRAVELGDKLQGGIALKSGVRAGEQVVTQGAYALKARLLKSQISAD